MNREGVFALLVLGAGSAQAAVGGYLHNVSQRSNEPPRVIRNFSTTVLPCRVASLPNFAHVFTLATLFTTDAQMRDFYLEMSQGQQVRDHAQHGGGAGLERR